MTTRFIVNHLWQSSCFALLAGLLAFVLRRNSPKVRYWVWLSASLKFLLPFALLVSLGSVVPRPARQMVSVPASVFPNTLVQIAEPFSPTNYATVPAHAQLDWVALAIGILWALGFLAITLARCRCWFHIRAVLRASTPVALPIPVPAFVSSGLEEPGVVGFLRPALIVPAHLLEHLNPRQLHTVLAHELCHVRRRDNLFAAAHMLVEAIFWFHPLVWWIGSRLVEERELACDEEVLRLGCEPADYVQGILTVCRLCPEMPVAFVSGVTGADVKKRLRAILAGTVARELNFGRKVALTAIGLAALAAPIVVGVLNAPQVHAQSSRPGVVPAAQAEAATRLVAQIPVPKDEALQGARRVAQPVAAPLQFEVADIKVNIGSTAEARVNLSNGRFLALNVPLRPLIAEAWTITPDEVLGPSWLDDVRVDIGAKASTPQNTDADLRLMVRTLLQDRMKLVAHTENREKRVLALTIWKGRPKLMPSDAPRTAEEGDCSVGVGTIGVRAICNHMTMAQLAHELPEIAPRYVDQLVVDQTNLRGTWDFIIEWAPQAEAETGGGLSLFAALQAQLGLELKAKKLPVPVLIVDSMARAPTSN